MVTTFAIVDPPPFCNNCKGYHWGLCTAYGITRTQQPESRCLSTFIYRAPHTLTSHGIQCKFTLWHQGKHCGYADHHVGDVFWTNAEAET